jgi:hypothetical protein
MQMFRPRPPSAALVVSVVALIVALGGTAYASWSVSKNSVGTKQLRNGAVTTEKIKNKAVTAAKINTKGLVVPNAGSAISAGSAANAINAANATNAISALNATNATTAATATALASVSYRVGPSVNSPKCAKSYPDGTTANPCPTTTEGTETCPPNTVVIGGGAYTSNGGMEITVSRPESSAPGTSPNEWDVWIDNFDAAAGNYSFNVYAICINANTVDNPSGAAAQTPSATATAATQSLHAPALRR